MTVRLGIFISCSLLAHGRTGAGMLDLQQLIARLQTTNTEEPVVLRASRSRCACTASFIG